MLFLPDTLMAFVCERERDPFMLHLAELLCVEYKAAEMLPWLIVGKLWQASCSDGQDIIHLQQKRITANFSNKKNDHQADML